MKRNVNNIDMYTFSYGNYRRAEILDMPVDKGAIMPKPVTYEDIDKSVKDFVESLHIVSDDGTEYPTITLFSNQRFSEYAQSWKYTDDNNNLLLNFKTITRENNPQYGKINSGLWNIPGRRFYRLKRMKVLDDNGSESFLDLSMRQPMAADLIYKVSVFTTKYQSLNDFNILINKYFQSRQCYVAPNGYYMPMKLESISDESEYSINDRQFYSQTYSITLMGYVLTEDDFRISEVPLKRGLYFNMGRNKRKATVEVEECDEWKEKENYRYQQTILRIEFPKCVNKVAFTMDEDFKIESYDSDNIAGKFTMLINGEEVLDTNIRLIEKQDVEVIIKRRNSRKEAILTLYGYDPNNAVKTFSDGLDAE